MLGIFGLIFAIVAPIIVYRNAKQNGHNAVLWTLLALVVGIGIQIVIPLIVGLIIGVVMVAQGSSEAEIQQVAQGGPILIFGIVCLVLSIIGVFLIMNRVNRINESPSYVNPPAPPTDFNQNG